MKNTLTMRGDIRILEENSPVLEFHNLETDYTLRSIAKALAGEEMDDILPTSMAFGTGTSTVEPDDNTISEEVVRKPVTVSRVDNTVKYRVTLNAGENLGTLGTIGLFNGETGSSANATGTITVGGTPKQGDTVTVRLDSRALPVFTLDADASTDEAAEALRIFLLSDDTLAALFSITRSGSDLTLTSVGKGTYYNRVLTTSVTGTITATATGAEGGSTPEGNLLAAANINYSKATSRQAIVEWSITVGN
jgi:hypothetical protein